MEMRTVTKNKVVVLIQALLLCYCTIVYLIVYSSDLDLTLPIHQPSGHTSAQVWAGFWRYV